MDESMRIVINSGGTHHQQQQQQQDEQISATHYKDSWECFVVDIDYLSQMGNQKRSEIISNSSTSIHRSISRKGSSSSSSHQLAGKGKTQTQKDTTAAAATVAGVGVVIGADHHHHESCNEGTEASLIMGTPNKQPSIIVVGGGGGVGVNATDPSNINSSSSSTKTVKETVIVKAESSRWRRYNSINQRYSSSSSSSSFSSWIMNPRRILLFFATLSSIGTIILIYFTLSMAKLDGEDHISHSQAP